MKKIIALFLAAAVFVLAGCSDTNKDYSVLLPFVNGSKNDKIEVTLAFVNNDSRMITGNPGASTAEGYVVDSGKYIKVKITDKNETLLCEESEIQAQETGKISLYIDKVNFNNLKAATVTVTGYTIAAEDGTHQEFTKGTLKDVDLTLGKTIYVPMEYIITEGEASPSGNITFSVGYNSQSDWENNGFDVSEVGETAVFDVSYAPLNGGTETTLSKIETEPLTENGYYVGNPSGILDHLKFRIEDKSGYYKLKVTWKNCPVIVNGIKITQDVDMIIANDNIFCIPDYGSVTINNYYYEPKFYMPVKKLWAVNGTAEGDGESMATPASLSSLLITIASDDKYKLYSINCSKIATKIYGDGGYYLFDAYMYDATSINNIACNAEKYINIKSTDFNASMMIQSKDGKMIAVANESIAVTKSGAEEAFLPAELQTKSETDSDGNTTEYFDFILEKGAKVDILNTDFNPNGINVYADDNYHIYQETDNYTTYDQWSSCCFARQEIGIDATTTDALDNTKCKIYIYNSTDKTYVRNYSVVIGTTNQYTADNLKRYKLLYLKQN